MTTYHGKSERPPKKLWRITLFSLVQESKAVNTPGMIVAWYKTKHFDEYTNNVEQKYKLDLANAKRWALKEIHA